MQALFIFLAIILGILIPQAHQLTFLIRPNLMVMLFIAFLNISFHSGIIKWDHLKVVLANLLIPVLGYLLVAQFDEQLGILVFVLGIAPTAAGAPVIAEFLESKVEFVTASVLLTNPVSAIAIPFLLPLLMGSTVEIRIGDILLPVLSVVFVPLVASICIKQFAGNWLPWLYAFRKVPFYLFLGNVFIASAKATDFITQNLGESMHTIYWIAGVTAMVCLFQFTFGAAIGQRSSAVERSLSLARKNTMFAIWVSLTFLSPIIALGPMFYILYQNIYNTIQMYQIKQKSKVIT